MSTPLPRLTLRGVLARKFRILLTILAVVSGVAFVSGAFILTDSVKSAISSIFEELRGDIDLEIRSTIAFGDEATAERDPVPVSLIDDIAAVPGVALAEANIIAAATIIDADGDPLRTSGPAFGISWTGPDGLDGRILLEGRTPTGPGEVAID
ncbi:MAG: ABC transporter permease, partial [Actinomycetota bacterium]